MPSHHNFGETKPAEGIESPRSRGCDTIPPDMADEIIFYQFSRSKVERCAFSHFLSLYAPDKLPTGRRLGEMMNGMMFGIKGWDADPREIHSIPEIRRFYAAYHQTWPY
jgi:hypothetical protein